MFTLNILFLISFTLVIIIDSLIRNKNLSSKLKLYYYQLIEMSFLSLFFIFFSIILFILILLNLFDITLIFNMEENFLNLENNMDKNDNNLINSPVKNNNINVNTNVSGKINDGTFNLNTQNLKIKMPTEGINNLAAAASSAGGATLAVKIAKQIPGTPVAKVAVGLGVMGTVQATTAIMSKVLNKNNNNNLSNSFIGNMFTNSNTNELNNLLSEFPFNLLPEMNHLVNIEILFLSILFNIYIVNILTKFNYSKYIPKNKLGKILNFLISRYITIWSKSKLIILIIS